MQVHTLDLQFQGHARAIASFLVEGPGGWILVETGPESTRDRLWQEIRSLGVEPHELGGVFVTHIHLDHAGAAGLFASCGVPVFVHPRGAKHLIDPARLIESARMVYGDRFDSLWGGMTPAPAENVRIVEDGEIVEVAGLRVEAMATPGHAFHQHAFFIEGACFAGDAAGARLGSNPFTSVTSAPPQFDLELTLSTVNAIRDRNPEALYLTHFGDVPEPGEHLAAYREAVELNALFVKQRLDEGMDADSLRVAYQAFQLEQAFRGRLPREMGETYQAANGTDMCADGLRLYWEKQREEET